ncbi:DMT family transporter [Lentilactobacillus otakiensis]|uniref:Membrane protein n=1 Tax=Lentilactobacillus otakiensis DSM 19908 = JCM 15040 TaxID=1423780 RepID=S4NKY8_9LACO|nr:DMT family transporter [Lentilactobacillus otakiensis]KRL09833.1 membrane protein [Lentilactobacillus otakiensis DSM 19908 = JCM 15040]MBZ3776177.1 DMT family transporter [Lentilactobacillus otakiensis]MDV3517184.1 DMT family transporter [Lentilactobacillus otakiensis]GAD16576.1 membrane protein [Lentilactobacillus otakiensis DSM 19908 = JCM 15040]
MKRYAPLFVALGAISYGIPGSLFKMARADQVTDSLLLSMTFLIAFIIFSFARRLLKPDDRYVADRKLKWLVIISGSSMGFTNTFYLLSLAYVPVAIAAVMMMQSVWLSIAISCLIHRQFPTVTQAISVITILIGTVLATGLFPLHQNVSWKGMGLSFLSALAYALTIQFTGNVGSNLHPLTKAQLMSGGALIVILVIWLPTILPVHHLITGIQWGGITSFFAMLLPLTCFSFFMPHLSLGIGPIISSLELPSSVVFAFILLGEAVTISQIVGVCLIILAVILSNILPFRLHGQYQQMRP